MASFNYEDIDDFYDKNSKYPTHECERCGRINEIEMKEVEIYIEYKQMVFKDIPVLVCQSCGNIQLSLTALKSIGYINSLMNENGEKRGEFKHTGYKKAYDYCKTLNLIMIIEIMKVYQAYVCMKNIVNQVF